MFGFKKRPSHMFQINANKRKVLLNTPQSCQIYIQAKKNSVYAESLNKYINVKQMQNYDYIHVIEYILRKTAKTLSMHSTYDAFSRSIKLNGNSTLYRHCLTANTYCVYICTNGTLNIK